MYFSTLAPNNKNISYYNYSELTQVCDHNNYAFIMLTSMFQ